MQIITIHIKIHLLIIRQTHRHLSPELPEEDAEVQVRAAHPLRLRASPLRAVDGPPEGALRPDDVTFIIVIAIMIICRLFNKEP